MLARLSSLSRASLLALGLVALGACGAPASSNDAPPPADSSHEVAPPVVAQHDEPAAPRFDRAAMRDELAKARDAHVAELEAYARKGIFPTNDVVKRTANVFRDKQGHLCAVANMIHLDGKDELVDRAATANNLVILADLKTGELVDWIATSGFLREEIAQIQAPYVPMRADEQATAAARLLAQRAEQQRLVARLTSVVKQLRHDREASLDEAVDRLIAKRTAELAPKQSA